MAAKGKFGGKLGPSTEYHENWQKCFLCKYKPNLKHNHSSKLLEEVIQDVVSLLLVLPYLCNVGVGILFTEYQLCNNWLLKSKISSQSIKQFFHYSLLKILGIQCEINQDSNYKLQNTNFKMTVGTKPFYGLTRNFRF